MEVGAVVSTCLALDTMSHSQWLWDPLPLQTKVVLSAEKVLH